MANELADVAGAVAQGANPVTAIVGLGKDLIDRFVPDPQKKAEAEQHLLDVQAQMQTQIIQQQDKIIEATSANQKSDPHMSTVRAFFCVSVTLLYIWNYALCRFFHQPPIDLPTSLDAMFATIMLGFVGIPSGLEAAKTIMGMPGETEISVPGFKARNKS